MNIVRGAVLCAFLLASGLPFHGCAARHGAAPAPAATAAPIEARLRADLDRVFSDPHFAHAQWGVKILSLDSGRVLYEKNAERLYMPASNNKILSAAAALVRLGQDYRYETRIAAAGDVVDGRLQGSLVIIGSGDPTISARFAGGDPLRVFREWGARLAEAGIREIAGDLVADGRAFPEPRLGEGWAWDDLAFGYAAPVTALQFNENLARIEVRPGTAVESPASTVISPLPDFTPVRSCVTTAPAQTEPQITLSRGADWRSVVLSGSIPLSAQPLVRSASAPDPTLYYLAALKEGLRAAGMKVGSCNLRTIGPGDPAELRTLFVHRSPPLSEILKPMLKASQNLLAETLPRTLGLAASGSGSFEKGSEVVKDTLALMSVERDSYRYADGSGLSRLNLLSAELLVRILRYMYRHPSFSVFYDALPIAGIDGTIEQRMKGTRAENNVRAKTGTIAHVRSLSGYVRTSDGEMLAFSMIANNFLASSRAAEYVQDSALEILAGFSRK